MLNVSLLNSFYTFFLPFTLLIRSQLIKFFPLMLFHLLARLPDIISYTL